MEPKMPALSSSHLDLHPLPEELHELNKEFSEENITYSEVRTQCSSDIQKKKRTRILKIKESPWCIAAVVFALLYLIFLAVAAFMIAKVQCLEDILKAQESSKQSDTEEKALWRKSSLGCRHRSPGRPSYSVSPPGSACQRGKGDQRYSR
ncbi:uncharacterized protein V5649_014887 [Rhynchonycteris naso]